MRAWSWCLVLGMLLTVASGAEAEYDERDELARRRAPVARPAPVLRDLPPPPPRYEGSSFDIDAQRSSGWYEAELPELPEWIDHVSLPRDTIETVAARYAVSPRRLRRWNGMSPSARLNPEQPRHLRVRAMRYPPPREHLVHVAREGEDWTSLGRRYGVFPRHLRAWNREHIGRSVEPGEQVEVWVEPMVRSALASDGLISGRAAEIPRGAHSIGTPQDGRLVSAVQVPEGPGYERRYPNSCWGTTYAVRHLVDILDRFHRSGAYSGTLMLGSMSFRHGGKIAPHVSHQSGRDIDIRLPVKPGISPTKPITRKSIDFRATWWLVLAFAHSGAVEAIFLDYRIQARLYRAARASGASQALLDEVFQFPNGSHSSGGIVKHSKGHEGHIHVRFACGPFEPACG